MQIDLGTAYSARCALTEAARVFPAPPDTSNCSDEVCQIVETARDPKVIEEKICDLSVLIREKT